MRQNLTILLLLSLLPATALAAKTDNVLLVNGNTVTGEIEQLEFGDLEYKTDSMGTVNIDWEDVVAITTNRQLQVEVSNGTRFFGNLQGAQERFYISVITEHGPVEIAMSRIVRIIPIDTSKQLIKRIEGDFSLGFNSQRGSEVTTFNTSADVRYRTFDYLVGLKLNSSITDQPSEETQSRHTIGINYQRFMPNRWYTDWFSNWERNDQLGIESRLSLGGGLGRYIIQTNRNQVSLMTGLQGTREEFTGQDPGDTVGEARVQFRWLHRKLKPESSITFTTNYYPLIEELSTYRMESSLVWAREFLSDFDLMLDLYYTYQSQPPTEGSRTDHGVVWGLSYSW